MNLLRFSKCNSSVFNLSCVNSYHQYKLEDERMEHSTAKKDLRVLRDGSWM